METEEVTCFVEEMFKLTCTAQMHRTSLQTTLKNDCFFLDIHFLEVIIIDQSLSTCNLQPSKFS